MTPKKIKLQVKFDSLTQNFEGDSDEVIKALIQFLYGIYPQLEIVSKLVWTPNIQNLVEKSSNFGKITPEGDFIQIRNLPSTEQEILFILTLAYLSSRIGQRKEDFVEVHEISKMINKAEKTVRNILAEFIKSGTAERIDKGLYKITQNGLRQIEETLLEAL